MKFIEQVLPISIMLADDDVDDRYSFKKALAEIPIATNLKTVNNGDQLMKYLASHTAHLPDILFLDLNMPYKTGFECLHEIKESNLYKKISVITLTTAFTKGTDLVKNLKKMLINMGAGDHLTKPVDFEELKALIYLTIAGHAANMIKPEEENIL